MKKVWKKCFAKEFYINRQFKSVSSKKYKVNDIFLNKMLI